MCASVGCHIEVWNFRYIEIWNFRYIEIWNFRYIEIWNYGISKYGTFGISKYGTFGISKYGTFDISKYGTFEISKYGTFGKSENELSVNRNMELSIYRNMELSIYRNVELSRYRMERVLPSITWHPRVFFANTERKLPCIKYRIRIISIVFFVYRHRIEVFSDADVDIQHYNSMYIYRSCSKLTYLSTRYMCGTRTSTLLYCIFCCPFLMRLSYL